MPLNPDIMAAQHFVEPSSGETLKEIALRSPEISQFLLKINRASAYNDDKQKREYLLGLDVEIDLKIADINTEMIFLVAGADAGPLLNRMAELTFVREQFLTPNIPPEVEEVKEVLKESTVFELVVDQLKLKYQADLPSLVNKEIDLDTCTPDERRSFVMKLREALWRRTLDIPLNNSVTEKYPVEDTNLMSQPLFSIESKVNASPSLMNTLDNLPESIKPAYEWFRSQFLAVHIHHNRAVRFINIFRSQDEKSISSITDVYQKMGDSQGGGNPFDMNALYSRTPPEGAKELLGDKDEEWQLGNIVNTVIARTIELIKENPSEYNPFPWTLRSSNRQALEREIRKELGAVTPPLDTNQVEIGVLMAFWEIRSFGVEFFLDKNAEDQRFSRLMNMRDWIRKSAVVNRAYEYTPHIGDVWKRLMVSQEEFLHVVSEVPADAIIPGTLDDYLDGDDASKSKWTELKSRYRRFDTDIDAKSYISSLVSVVKFKPDYCTWKNQVRSGEWIIVPKNFIKDNPKEADSVQIMLPIDKLRRSNLDLDYTNWASITSGANDKYAFVAGKFGDWFEQRGTITTGEAGTKSFADIRKMEGHDVVPVEQTAFYLADIKKKVVSARSNISAFATSVGFGSRAVTESEAVELDEATRQFISVATLTESDFGQWGFRAFFHQPNDYLISKLKEAGGSFSVKQGDNIVSKTLPTLEILREMIRSRDGRYIPKLISNILEKYDDQQAILLMPDPDTTDPVEIRRNLDAKERARKIAEIQLKKLQVELFKVAIDLHLERYVYNEMEKTQKGTYVIDSRGWYMELERLPYGTRHEIETVSGRPPLDFIDRETFIQSVVQYCNSLLRLWLSPEELGKLKDGTLDPEFQIANMPDRDFLVDLMKQKGIIGTSRQAEIDRSALQTKARYGSVPDRIKRQEADKAAESGSSKKH